MNGSDCEDCGAIPCKCVELKEKRRIKEGREALEVTWDVFSKGPKGWKQRIIKWLWPDVSRIADAIMNYYWSQ